MDFKRKIRKLIICKVVTKLILPDKIYYQYCYFIMFGKWFSYSNPVGFNAKLQWLKVYYRLPELVKLADKLEVRNFVANTIGEKYLNPVLHVYSNAKEINWDSLPDKFVIKATHGSGWNIVCTDKKLLNRKKTTRKLNKWLKRNAYYKNKEWQYKDMKPRLICEKYLEQKEGNLLELKVFCYNGSPEFIIAYEGNGNFRNTYNKSWEKLKCKITFPQGPEIEKPDNLDVILDLASKLSSGFPFVRVDFLINDKRIYFGELTFTPARGLYRFNPPEFDIVFGEPLKLPLQNKNLIECVV